MKELTWRCGCVEVRVRIGRRDSPPAQALRRYRVASRDSTAELREAMWQRISAAAKGASHV